MNPSIKEYEIGITTCASEVKSKYPNLLFDWAGIIPTFDQEDKYWCSPTNTQIIGRTGGDGVHFSVLSISKQISPVIMTVPSNFGHEPRDFNVILGESIIEFIGLGVNSGWFPLEQIVYQGETFIESFGETKLIGLLPDSADGYFTAQLASYFNATFIKLQKQRLMELEELYFNKLEFDHDFK